MATSIARSIILGKTANENSFPIDHHKINYHTCILGQSGSGKSFTLSRYLEEILLSDAGQIVLFDFNFEYSKFNRVNNENFKSKFNYTCCKEDDLKTFSNIWSKIANKIHSNKANEIIIKLSDLTKEEINSLINIDPKLRPGAYWLLELIIMDDLFKSELFSKQGVNKLLNRIERWSEGRLRSDEYNFGDRPKEIQSLTNRIDIVQLKNGLNYLQNKDNLLFYLKKLSPVETYLDKYLIEKIFKDYLFYSLDLLNFDYDIYRIRDFIFNYFLKLLWRRSKRRYIDAYESNKLKSLKPIFIVIDEAHNIVSNDASNENSNIVQTIASEGRKFKVFLIITTQNPEKINPHIFSECDNFIFMKSNQKASKYFEESQGLEQGSVANAIKGFQTGDAFLFGQFTDYSLTRIKSSIKRTR